jgi:uncharacterized small protein (DUF1192 family)
MSKKIIAVAAAAALALSALVATPASASWGGVTVEATATGTGASSTTAHQIPVPSADVIRAATDTGNRSGAKIDVLTQTASATVTVTATGGVKLLSTTAYASATTNAATGTSTLTITSDAAKAAVFYVYSTSTTAASMTVSETGATPNSTTLWIQGVTSAINTYKMNFTVPATAALSGSIEYTGQVLDMFDNPITTGTVTPTVLGADAAAGTLTYDSVDKRWEGKATARSTAGTVALNIATTDKATKVSRFGDVVNTAFYTVSVENLATQITALTAQIAALQAQLEASRPMATSVTKKKYNTLARKWNAANPGNKVALKK